MITDFNELQPLNVDFLIIAISSGSVKVCKPLQPQKALSPMDVTELGMVTEVRPLQPAKARYPMDVTELGMVTEVRPLQYRNILNIDNQSLTL